MESQRLKAEFWSVRAEGWGVEVEIQGVGVVRQGGEMLTCPGSLPCPAQCHLAHPLLPQALALLFSDSRACKDEGQ